MTPYLTGLAIIAIATPILFCVALGIERWFFACEPDPEEPMEQPKRIEDVTLVEDELPKALHRLKEMGFRFQRCGHSTYEFCAVKGVCLQCVVEGRIAAKDLGRNRNG